MCQFSAIVQFHGENEPNMSLDREPLRIEIAKRAPHICGTNKKNCRFLSIILLLKLKAENLSRTDVKFVLFHMG